MTNSSKYAGHTPVFAGIIHIHAAVERFSQARDRTDFMHLCETDSRALELQRTYDTMLTENQRLAAEIDANVDALDRAEQAAYVLQAENQRLRELLVSWLDAGEDLDITGPVSETRAALLVPAFGSGEYETEEPKDS